MDIQKEREAFKQHLTDTGLVEFAGYGFAVDECDEYLHEPTQVAWDSWLIGLNRAKAQAVPEWISVKDNLPPANILVLGMSQTRSNIFNIYNVMALDEFEEADVTHWMPLPDAPQEPAND